MPEEIVRLCIVDFPVGGIQRASLDDGGRIYIFDDGKRNGRSECRGHLRVSG
jgi:hypothetical protein